MKLSSLAKLAIDTYNGLDRWRQFKTVSARLLTGGVLWPLKRQQGVLDRFEDAPIHDGYLQLYPYGYTCHFVRPNWRLPSGAELQQEAHK